MEKLLNLVSLKGKDIMIQARSEETLRYHRVRASLPASLWNWKTITGWHWTVLTTLRWRITQKKTFHSKFIHMIDSLVCLYTFSVSRTKQQQE